MNQKIRSRIEGLEKRELVRVLFAVESGSRAWGFASRDSDYDIRFVYAHSREWYVSLAQRRDTIECPLDGDLLDLSGWDIQKALKLFAKSNPPLLEWIKSPIVYKDEGGLRAELQSLEQVCFSPGSCTYHYLHMATGNYREYLQHKMVRVKKYFYVLRPVLACEWIRNVGSPPPMQFDALVGSQVDDRLLSDAIHALTLRKVAGDELLVEPRISIINDYIEDRIKFYTEYTRSIPKKQPEIELLDRTLRKHVGL